MNLRKLTLLFALPFFAAVTHAQLGVYGHFTGERVGGITCLEPNEVCGSESNSQTVFGGGAGAYYDFYTLGPARIGADIRTTVMSGRKSASQYFSQQYRLYSTLGGLHASFKTPIRLVRPYVLGTVGLGRTNLFETNSGYSNHLQYQAFTGVDIPLFPILDFRLIEVGIGGISGSLQQPGTHIVRSIGTGIVFHFPR